MSSRTKLAPSYYAVPVVRIPLRPESSTTIKALQTYLALLHCAVLKRAGCPEQGAKMRSTFFIGRHIARNP